MNRLAIDVFLRPQDAYASLEEVVTDEPQLAELLYVAPLELDERPVSPN